MKVDEASFESAICNSLVETGGYEAIKFGNSPEWSGDFDSERGIDAAELRSFIEETQPEAWAKLTQLHGDATEASTRFLDRLRKELDRRGTVNVLRHGVVDLGVTIRLAFFQPAHGLTPELVARYEANRLTVTRQLPYQEGSNATIDLCLFVNGLPVATAELKNPLTGQKIEHAIEQYRTDRDPKNTTLGRRAVVHFAVDTEAVAMTTRLAGKTTRFLPFNRGHEGGAGNPPNPDGHRTSYLWEQVWQRDSWLDLLARFVHVEKAPKGSKGPDKVIFPRFHQWQCVLALEADAMASGAGEQYLVEHSAGSGKSNSISWLAHRLSNLHDDEDQKVFDKVVVITDRVVLDRQLQDTIYQFEHAHGVVERIDEDSRQLADALAGEQARIVITTLQKFPVVLEQGVELPGRRYAVIVDEAHSSQTGEAAKDLKLVLGAGATPDRELTVAEVEDSGLVALPESPAEEALAEAVTARGRQPNLSFFAFTATPKARTLELFGHFDETTGHHEPFHLYSMRQAIEEGFILDVLASYVTYETFWNIEKTIDADPEYETSAARRSIAKVVTLHAHNLSQRAEIIVEHFRQHVAHKIGGRAKAMVVTSSRLHAVRYKQALDRYIEQMGYGDIATLVAFSGTVVDGGIDYTESGMNQFPDTQTAGRFASDEYQVMVVAEKYQTGFDQPLLYAMYVDKTLTGLAAVQTLSRLNRIHDEKDGTFVLDFRNDGEDIRQAFEPYYGKTVAAPTDPNMLYDTRHELDHFDVMREDEAREVAELLSAPGPASVTAKVHAVLGAAVERFWALDDEQRHQFRDALNRFVRIYSFLSQIVLFADTALERDYLYGKALASLIRDAPGAVVDLGSEVELTHLRIEKTSEGRISLPKSEGEVQWVVRDAGPGPEDEEVPLSVIVERLNDRFGTDWSEEDRLFFDAIFDDLAKEPKLQIEAAANPLESFSLGFDKTFEDAIVGRLDRNQKMAVELLDRPELREAVQAAYLPRLYNRARVARQRVAPIGELIGPDREDRYLEYKSTLRWDIAEQSKKTGIPEDAVVKTIAGFLNSEHGGTLLIGVADDGSIHGLEGDYKTFSKRGERGDRDLFGQHLENLIVQRLGAAAATLVNTEFHRIDGDDLCRMSVEPSTVPVFEQGEEPGTFWWRYPSGTRQITDERERAVVVARRWPPGAG